MCPPLRRAVVSDPSRSPEPPSRSRQTGPLLGALLGLTAIAPGAGSAGAQETSAPDLWSVVGELGASVFFGNTEQTTLTTRAAVERSDSTWEVSADGGFTYGEATDDAGESFVNRRRWSVRGQVDYRPYDRWSPFAFATVESSLEKLVDLRTDVGAGAKYTWTRAEERRVDLSVAVLAERLDPREEPGGPVLDTETRARWSTRFRARRELAEGRIVLSTVNFWQPLIGLEEFTATSESSLAFQLTDVVALRLTFVDNYDSEAESRGADTNNDGQLFFSVLGSF